MFVPNDVVQQIDLSMAVSYAAARRSVERSRIGLPPGGLRGPPSSSHKASRMASMRDRANLRPAHKHLDRDVYNNGPAGKRNVHVRPSGNSRAAFLRRLRKDRPDIHGRVLAGELSAYAGMVEAGFRKKPLPSRANEQTAPTETVGN